MKSWARMKWRQHPAAPVRPASSTTRLGTGNVTRVGTKSAPFTPGADPSRDGSGWPSRRKGSISMKSVTLFNPITRPAITTTTAKKYIDLFSFSVELGREEKSIQSGNGLMTRSNFESIFCWWLFYFSFHRLELTIFSAQWRREAHRLRKTLSLYYREHKLRPSYLDRTINWFIREPHFFCRRKMLRAMKHYTNRSDNTLAWHTHTRQKSRGFLRPWIHSIRRQTPSQNDRYRQTGYHYSLYNSMKGTKKYYYCFATWMGAIRHKNYRPTN